MKLDRSALPEGVSLDRKEGLYAELGPEGQVIHLGIYENGERQPGTWALDVAPDGSWARVDRMQGSGEPKDAPPPDEGPPGMLEAWVQLWMIWISKGSTAPKTSPTAGKSQEGNTPPLSCSFCGKGQHEVKQLVAGPKVYICNECVGLCNDIIGFEQERDSS